MTIRSFGKNILFFLLYTLFPRLKNKASILMYHSVGRSDHFFTVTPENFEQQIKYLVQGGFEIIPLGVLVQRMSSGEPIGGAVAITFDDGYKDNYEIVFPIIKKYAVPITIFLATDMLGGEMRLKSQAPIPMMGEPQVREMQRSSLVSFSPHSKTHRSFGTLSLSEIQNEIDGSRTALSLLTGTVPTLFSFPRGHYTSEALSYLRDSGWDGAVTVREGLVSRKDNQFLLKRNSIDSTTTFIQFKAKVSEAIEWYGKLKRP